MLNNITRHILTLLFICSFSTIFGQSVSKEEAISKAKQFVSTTFPQSRASDDAQFEQVDIAKYLYVFNLSTGGYVIVSGEPTTESIIGYSTSGKIDKNNLPSNLKAVLNGYENEIKSSIGTKEPLSRADATPHYNKAIEPLVKVKWNQGSPYDKYTPYVDGQKTPTGCVPTAMAQLMGHYKWPKKGHGYITHGFVENDKVRIDSINLDTTPIDWANMCDTYRGNETEEQKEAVAMLMRMCGYACGVNYKPSGSGVGGGTPANALKNHFYYKVVKTDKNILAVYLDMHNFMYEALKEKKPLICSIVGLGGDPGHEVIVDGCDKNGFFHINFGWGGSHDGYFRMCSRKYVGYTFGIFEDVILAEPDYEMREEEDSTVEPTTAYIGITDNEGKWNYTEDNGDEDEFTNGLYNSSDYRNIEIGLRIAVSEKENKYISLCSFDKEGNCISNEYVQYSGLQTKVKYLAELASMLNLNGGKYKCYPAYRKFEDNEWKDIEITLHVSASCIFMLVKDSKIVFSTPDINKISVRVEDKTICIDDYYTTYNINIFNTYGLLVYSGSEDKIKVNSAGVYTIKIGWDFHKSVIVK